MASEAVFPMVGIGASAGGVEALTSFFRAVPADSGLAYVVVTHLGPGRESMLHDILAHVARIPVERAVDGELLQPNQAYVLATAASLLVEGGRLRVRTSGSRQQNPIDVCLASLAQDQGEHAIGVLLSGSGSDGTLGLKAIKERGGLTVVQGTNGTGPQHASMPDTAIAAGTVDLVLPVEDIPARLVGYAQGLLALDGLAAPEGPAPEVLGLAEVRPAICDVLRNQVGHDFSGYKEPTFLRRMQRRMQVLQVDTAQGYLERLHQDPEEVVRLFRDLLIGVTSFFRDVAAFEALERAVVPKLFEGRGADATVRVWVPGCATGEEAFTIAMLLREHMDTLRAAPAVQIFATDIDEHALAIARAGRYPAAMLSGAISPERLRALFHRRWRDDDADQGGARPLRFLRSQCRSRSAVLACRSDFLPKSADLPGRRNATARDAGVSLCPPAWRQSVPWLLREHRAVRCAVRAGGTDKPHFPPAGPPGRGRATAMAVRYTARAPSNRSGQREASIPYRPAAAPYGGKAAHGSLRSGPCGRESRRRGDPLLYKDWQVPRGGSGRTRPAPAGHGSAGAAA